jgi:uncharacterized protein (DUF1778 family)
MQHTREPDDFDKCLLTFGEKIKKLAWNEAFDLLKTRPLNEQRRLIILAAENARLSLYTFCHQFAHIGDDEGSKSFFHKMAYYVLRDNAAEISGSNETQFFHLQKALFYAPQDREVLENMVSSKFLAIVSNEDMKKMAAEVLSFSPDNAEARKLMQS